ncbi:hypothetical protein LOS25_17845 [Enterococcus faecium]|nr:hypothetical protein [Enterococcus faecium]
MKIDDFKQNLSDKELNEFIENFDKYKEIRKNLLQQRKKIEQINLICIRQ